MKHRMKTRNVRIVQIVHFVLFALLAFAPVAHSQTAETIARQFISNGPEPFFSHGRTGRFTLLATQSSGVKANLYEVAVGARCFALTEFAWPGGNDAQVQVVPARCSFYRARLKPLNVANFARQILDHYVESSVSAGPSFNFLPLASSSSGDFATVGGEVIAGASTYTLVEFTGSGEYSLFVGKIR